MDAVFSPVGINGWCNCGFESDELAPPVGGPVVTARLLESVLGHTGLRMLLTPEWGSVWLAQAMRPQ